MYVKNNDILSINSYACMFFQILAQILDSDGAKDILFLQFSCEKRIFFAPIQTIFGWYDYKLLFHVFFSEVFFPKCLSYTIILHYQ
jgi:hypothetical protein